jgi:hypothetical protein
MLLVKILSALSPLMALLMLGIFIYLFLFISRFTYIKWKKKELFDFYEVKRLAPVLVALVITLLIFKLMSVTVLAQANKILKNDKSEIIINGEHLNGADKSRLIKNFFFIESSKYRSGSQPTLEFELFIKGAEGELRFTAKADFRESDLYWLYYPEYKFKSTVGFLRTTVINRTKVNVK